ncbi:hypothetical protein [Snodgrassella alvi]|jgi:hypothetical protein|uniref:hypothetical protein n=1 Tax=Snodgrassella alvi TaxID=1196083 RepID=UPI0015D556E6|nr:hypothetical protein [Snodgrassella alvi]
MKGFIAMLCTGRFAVFEAANLQAGLLISLFFTLLGYIVANLLYHGCDILCAKVWDSER